MIGYVNALIHHIDPDAAAPTALLLQHARRSSTPYTSGVYTYPISPLSAQPHTLVTPFTRSLRDHRTLTLTAGAGSDTLYLATLREAHAAQVRSRICPSRLAATTLTSNSTLRATPPRSCTSQWRRGMGR